MNPKRSIVFTCLSFLSTGILTAQNITIPDAVFKAELLANTAINTNANNEIENTEAAAYTGSIDVTMKGIHDLSGIEAFVHISSLYCGANYLTALNVSNNTSITTLECDGNPITALDVSANIALVNLNCRENNLTALDVTHNSALKYLVCSYNMISSLDLQSNTVLRTLDVSHCSLGSLNLSNNTALKLLWCFDNMLSSLDVSANHELLQLNCSTNPLGSLDLSNNPDLTTLSCIENNLTQLDVTSNTALSSIVCFSNTIDTLDLSHNPALSEVFCEDNNLRYLNVKNGTSFYIFGQDFRAYNNPLLSCILVDAPAYSTANWHSVDPGVSFSETCGLIGLNAADKPAEALRIFPNPSNGVFTVHTATGQCQLFIKNLIGQEICSAMISHENTAIDLSAYPKGIYLYELRAKDQSVSLGKLIIE